MRGLIIISCITVAIAAAFVMFVAHELSSGPAGAELREVVLLPKHATAQVGTFFDHFFWLNQLGPSRQ
jgi:hypothetical protein